MILSFKKQFPWGKPTNFEQKIKDGVKIHSLREDPHGRWQDCRYIHMATGVRTKNYNCFLESECVSVQAIQIKWNLGVVYVLVDNIQRYVSSGTWIQELEFIKQLFKNDGFDSIEDFFKWFDSDFQGKIIHWTDFRY